MTAGNVQRKGQESVGSLSAPEREVVACWFPFKLIYSADIPVIRV